MIGDVPRTCNMFGQRRRAVSSGERDQRLVRAPSRFGGLRRHLHRGTRGTRSVGAAVRSRRRASAAPRGSFGLHAPFSSRLLHRAFYFSWHDILRVVFRTPSSNTFCGPPRETLWERGVSASDRFSSLLRLESAALREVNFKCWRRNILRRR